MMTNPNLSPADALQSQAITISALRENVVTYKAAIAYRDGRLTAQASEISVFRAEMLRAEMRRQPRIEALRGLLDHAQIEAAAGKEAIMSLASERAANARMTDELEGLREELQHAAAIRGARICIEG